MHRTEPAAAMRIGGPLAEWLLLRTGSRKRGEPGVDAPARRVKLGTSGVWQSAVEGAIGARGIGRQSQAGGSAAAVDGGGGGLSQAPIEPAWRRAPDLPVPVGRAGNHGSGSGVVQ